MTYTISVEKNGVRVPIARRKRALDAVKREAWTFSFSAKLCTVVVTRGSTHVITYRLGKITMVNGKAMK